MKLYASCMTCLLAGQEKKLREYPDENIKAQYMKELMRLVADSSEDDSAPWLAAQIGKTSEKYFGKAQGNFESLFGCGLNIYYLFLCKCDWFMRRFQVERYHGMFVNEKRIG